MEEQLGFEGARVQARLQNSERERPPCYRVARTIGKQEFHRLIYNQDNQFVSMINKCFGQGAFSIVLTEYDDFSGVQGRIDPLVIHDELFMCKGDFEELCSINPPKKLLLKFQQVLKHGAACRQGKLN